MKPKPQPKRELTIVSKLASIRLVAMRFASEDARRWAEQEVKPMGKWYDDDYRVNLYVHAEYDLDEVVAYIESYNDDEATNAEAS